MNKIIKRIVSVVAVAVMLTSSGFAILGMSQRATAYAETTISPCNESSIQDLARYNKTSILNFGEFANTQPIAVRRTTTNTLITYNSIKVSQSCDGLPAAEVVKIYADSMSVLGFTCQHTTACSYIFTNGNECMMLEYDKLRHRIAVLY